MKDYKSHSPVEASTAPRTLELLSLCCKLWWVDKLVEGGVMSLCRGKGGQGFFFTPTPVKKCSMYTTYKSKGSSLELVCFATPWSPPHSLQVNGVNDLLGPSPAVTSEDSVNNQCYKELSGGPWRTLEDIF